MPDFGIFRGFGSKLFGDKLYAGQLPTQLGNITFCGILDFYPSASIAYSLRKLRTAYTGSAIRVRRSSDNTEQDIGFDLFGNLDTFSLTSFCGSGNGFVTTWYDQSGNARNATQTTAANQPQIVSNGSIITENLKPSILFDGSNDNLFNTTTGFAINNTTHYVVSTRDNSGLIQTIFSTGILAGTIGFGFYYSSIDLLDQQTRNLSTVITSGGYSNIQGTINLISSINTTTSIDTYYNGSNILNTSATISGNSNTYITLGARYQNSPLSAGFFLNGKISEYVFWQNNLSSNINGINTNINTYYGIY